jgi:hypothetical protein
MEMEVAMGGHAFRRENKQEETSRLAESTGRTKRKITKLDKRQSKAASQKKKR